MSDQDRISSYSIKTISSKQVMRIKTNVNQGDPISNSSNKLHKNWKQVVRRITTKIGECKGSQTSWAAEFKLRKDSHFTSNKIRIPRYTI